MKNVFKKLSYVLFLLPSLLMAASPFDTPIWVNYLEGIGWAIAASIGFSIGVAIAIKVFDWFSGDIDEWEEIKKGNWSVAMIHVALIVMIGLLVFKVI